MSTANDLAKLAIALDQRRFLKQAVYEEMWSRPAKSSDGQTINIVPNAQVNYGCGWYLLNHRGRRIFGHDGLVAGFSAHFDYYVDNHTTVIALCNSDLGEGGGNQAGELSGAIAQSIFSRP